MRQRWTLGGANGAGNSCGEIKISYRAFYKNCRNHSVALRPTVRNLRRGRGALSSLLGLVTSVTLLAEKRSACGRGNEFSVALHVGGRSDFWPTERPPTTADGQRGHGLCGVRVQLDAGRQSRRPARRRDRRLRNHFRCHRAYGPARRQARARGAKSAAPGTGGFEKRRAAVP